MKTTIIFTLILLSGCAATKDLLTSDGAEINALEDSFEAFRLSAKNRLKEAAADKRAEIAAKVLEAQEKITIIKESIK